MLHLPLSVKDTVLHEFKVPTAYFGTIFLEVMRCNNLLKVTIRTENCVRWNNYNHNIEIYIAA